MQTMSIVDRFYIVVFWQDDDEANSLCRCVSISLCSSRLYNWGLTSRRDALSLTSNDAFQIMHCIMSLMSISITWSYYIIIMSQIVEFVLVFLFKKIMTTFFMWCKFVMLIVHSAMQMVKTRMTKSWINADSVSCRHLISFLQYRIRRARGCWYFSQILAVAIKMTTRP